MTHTDILYILWPHGDGDQFHFGSKQIQFSIIGETSQIPADIRHILQRKFQSSFNEYHVKWFIDTEAGYGHHTLDVQRQGGDTYPMLPRCWGAYSVGQHNMLYRVVPPWQGVTMAHWQVIVFRLIQGMYTSAQPAHPHTVHKVSIFLEATNNIRWQGPHAYPTFPRW